MPALAAVARGDDRLALVAPGTDHALDRLGREVGAVGEHDHRGLCVQRGQATAKGGARASLPVGAADDARVCLDVVRADHDDHLVHRRLPQPRQNLREEQPLLRRAEARRGARGKDDRGD